MSNLLAQQGEGGREATLFLATPIVFRMEIWPIFLYAAMPRTNIFPGFITNSSLPFTTPQQSKASRGRLNYGYRGLP